MASEEIKPQVTEADIPEECRMGLHSWVDEVGLLPPDAECGHCGEPYGHPD